MNLCEPLTFDAFSVYLGVKILDTEIHRDAQRIMKIQREEGRLIN